jgi:Chloroplast import apparatus Tic20-like
MTWRGTTTVSDRVFASLPYLLPLVEVLAFGGFLIRQFPIIGVLFVPLIPLLRIYSVNSFIPLLIFLALFMLVVRNEKINHFIRFNTMQAILLDIVIFLCRIMTDVIGLVPSSDFAVQTLYTTIFLGIVGAAIYSIAQSLLGRYAEIPAISEAVYTQVR